MNKEDFIKKLVNVTPEQLNRIIEEKGKKPRLINVFIKTEETKK